MDHWNFQTVMLCNAVIAFFDPNVLGKVAREAASSVGNTRK